ncbi:coiled-coil and c2 domain-containing protein 1-like protein [Plakobranchus ocellatus]|uniref:Coiled-coil and c2 domain-containing protein 1-like protein n=1 Tax=Plakobranchus ocellatus TaxID=259542 RepID=A0AAV3ZIN1_9GAST|nr:coiled-coil and c2 domain-containing protein 1-like protein [Plakobranchus ocellatus]
MNYYLPAESVRTVSKPQVSVPVQRTSQQAAGEEAEPDLPTMSAEEEKSMFNAPDAPQSVMEALSQRLDKYKLSESSAKSAGESGKARRMGRIVKQYEDAIKMYRAGKPVDFEELPTPPGFGPIPVGSKSSPAPTPTPKPAPSPSAGAPAPKPTAEPRAEAPAPVARGASASGHSHSVPSAVSGAGSAASARPQPVQRQNTGRKSMHSRQEQQLAFLKERMGEFKQAAMQAKKNHDIEMAKQYVRMMKGMEPMIEACEAGLPVDLSQVPPSPIGGDDAEDKFVVVSAEDCQPTGDREEVFKNLQADLVRQIRLCVSNAQHYQKLGDVPAASKFQKLEQNCRRDLESLKSAYRHADPAPRFHYETRSFSMVQSNTELGDADLEMTVVRGIQYNLPSGYSEKDMDTCVKYELGFPTDEPQTGTTGTVKDTINPEYNETFRLQINRKSKGFFRYVERKGIKLEIFMKRGFFKGDKLLGTVNVKLQPLENKCTVHDSYDLMDGRKTVGGKLEVKLRIRDPLKSKQVEEVKEKWLVIDQFIRTVGSKVLINVSLLTSLYGLLALSEGTMCMEVLRLEKQMLDKQISQLKDSLSVTQTQALRRKSALIEEKLELQQKKLREGGVEAWKAYVAVVKKEAVAFEQEARQFAKLGEVQKAELMMTKKKYAEKEIAAIAAKIPNM